ncbi:MAG: UDP-N-acetylmuramoyl-L-alanine--D-glutamate ligase [Bacteroidetes bacterium]|nr:UDP-N-acetylmuramoyl-L-alanine--D-glutamate ligase [Bacteroidota bacterium]
MVNRVAGLIRDRRICILGFGREGQSTYHFLRKYFPDIRISIADKNPQLPGGLSFLSNDPMASYICGSDYLEKISGFDLYFKTPGITMKTIDGRIDPERITSQADIFLGEYGRQIIGVTGTKGKSTTSSLIAHILNKSGKKVLLVGNIGIPPFDLYEEITPETHIVYELSSHQLETVCHSPAIAIILNFFEEHLDHYRSYAEYINSKLNILRYQKPENIAILNHDDRDLMELYYQEGLCSVVRVYSLLGMDGDGCRSGGTEIICRLHGKEHSFDIGKGLPIPGEHNKYNIMAALLACLETGAERNEIMDGLMSFRGLRHRIEYLGEKGGIRYYDDSISTIPQATIEAIKSLGIVEFLILGGYDRGINYDYLVTYLSEIHIGHIIFTGPAGKRMHDMMENIKLYSELVYVDSLEKAVDLVKQKGKQGDKCLLSPAAASYDAFRDFEERGDMFAFYAGLERNPSVK